MCNEFERYAVYWVPRWPDPLARFGTAWTGWCAERGEVRPRGSFPEIAVDREADAAGTVELAAVSRKLWRHGLHGVIRAPFALAPGRSQFSVEHVLDDLAEALASVPLPRLEVAVVEGRVALEPAKSASALSALVAEVVDGLEPLAARAETHDGADGFAEAPVQLAGGGAELLPFPNVRAARFHVPLTDALPIGRAHALRDALAPVLAPMLGAPRRLSELALMGDPGGGRPLRVLERYALREWPHRRVAAALPCQGPDVLAPMPEARRSKADAAV